MLLSFIAVFDTEPTKENGGPGFSGGDEAIANPMLAKIFSHTPTDNSTPGVRIIVVTL